MKAGFLKAIMGLVGAVSLASIGAILLFVSPPEPGGQDAFVPILFLLLCFLFLTSVATFLGVFVRRKFITEENRQRIFTLAFREGILLSLLLIVYVLLAKFDIFYWWSALIAFVFVVALEYLMLVRSVYR